MPTERSDRGSMLLVEECFAGEDPRFVDELRKVDNPKLLAAFADRWKADARPWAREQAFCYLTLPLDRPGHQPVVKRLFKHAEAANDHELVAAFMVAFDCHVRRKLTRRFWNWGSRTSNPEDVLSTPRDVLPGPGDVYRDPATGSRVPRPVPRNGRLFRYKTRYYLRRRAWRHFRHLGFRDPGAYPAAVAHALRRYRDTDFAKGENILDSWGLMHICFGRHEALEFGPTHPKLKAAHSFAELASAPAFAEAWQAAAAAPVLLELITAAESRLVRVWARQTFERLHPGHALTVEELLRLLDHDDAEVQQFGARYLESTRELATLPLTFWLQLLQTRSTEALAVICDSFARHVRAERLALGQLIELAGARPVPVARLGLRYLRERSIATPEDRAQVTALAESRCDAAAGDLTSWALGILGRPEVYQTDQVIRFFDSAREPGRDAAWRWLIGPPNPGADDPVLWSRLVESPYADVRLRLVDYLEQHQNLPGRGADDLKPLWTAVLLGVHRGGRQKLKAVRQLGHALIADAARAEQLLPVLAVAVRSVRGPESRAGLAALLGTVEARPELTEAVKRAVPELVLA